MLIILIKRNFSQKYNGNFIKHKKKWGICECTVWIALRGFCSRRKDVFLAVPENPGERNVHPSRTRWSIYPSCPWWGYQPRFRSGIVGEIP